MEETRHWFDIRARKSPWRRVWQPTPVLLPGECMDREAWWVTIHGVTKSWVQLKWLSMHAYACYNKCNKHKEEPEVTHYITRQREFWLIHEVWCIYINFLQNQDCDSYIGLLLPHFIPYTLPQVFTCSSKPWFGVTPSMSGSVSLVISLLFNVRGKGGSKIWVQRKKLCGLAWVLLLSNPLPCQSLPICEMRMMVLLLPATRPRLEAPVKP